MPPPHPTHTHTPRLQLKQKMQFMLFLIELFFLLTQSRDLNSNFTLRDCLFVGVKLAKNADPDKHVYSGHVIGFDFRSEFSLPDYNIGKKSLFLNLI